MLFWLNLNNLYIITFHMMKIVRIVIILQTSCDHNVSKNLQMPRGSSYSADKCSKNDVAAVVGIFSLPH
jgi:hypothetical protein